MESVKIVRSDGVTFNIDGKTWKLIDEIQGIDAANIELSTADKISGGGAVLLNQRTGTRDITIKAVSIVKDKAAARDNAIRFFKAESEYTYTLFITYMGKTRRAPCYLYKTKLPAINIYRTLELTVTFLSMDSYLTSADNNAMFIGKTEGNFGFPYVSIIGRGFAVGKIAPIKNVKALNNGDAKTGYILELKALGPIRNPIFKQDDYNFKVLDSLVENDILIMDFESNIPKITKNGVNIIQKISRDANFGVAGLKVGETRISYGADEGEEFMSLTLKYYTKFVGV